MLGRPSSSTTAAPTALDGFRGDGSLGHTLRGSSEDGRHLLLLACCISIVSTRQSPHELIQVHRHSVRILGDDLFHRRSLLLQGDPTLLGCQAFFVVGVLVWQFLNRGP